MITIVATACLCAIATDEGRDLKSLVRPQTFSCELRDVRLTRTIDEMSSGKVTINRGSESTTTKRTQSGSIKGTEESSSSNVATSHEGYDVRIGGRINAEGSLKWGLVPSGSVGGGAHLEGSAGTRRTNDHTRSKRSGAEVSVTDASGISSSRGQEKVVEDSVKSRLGGYKLVFSVVLKNRDVNDEVKIDSSRMCAKLRGPGLTGVISVPCSEQGEFTLGVDEKSFEFVYPINDERMLSELLRMEKSGQLSQLDLSQTGADIPVISKKSGKSILSEQNAIEYRNPSTAVSIEFGELQGLPSWRVSRRHTAKSGQRGTFVTLREALQGIGLLALDFSDTLPEQIFGFSKDGALARVLDVSAFTKGDDGCYKVLAFRLKDNKGKTSLGLPLADRIAINMADYSEVAIISFTFDEFVKWAVQFPDHFAELRKEIENWLVVVGNKEALTAFKKKIEAAQHEDDTRPLPKDITLITKNDIAKYQARANAGVPNMQAKLARCYIEGWGIEKDAVEAVRWSRKAAEQGNAEGQLCLGMCYFSGIGVVKNEMEGIKWFRKAAEQGNTDAQLVVGMFCLSLVEIDEPNKVEYEANAVKYFRMAAEHGDADGQVLIGDCYKDGIGVTKNETEAVKWFRKAAEQGHADGQVRLGECYKDGRGVTKNEVEAVKWFRKAAEQELPDAHFELGMCYLNGIGVVKNETEAVRWFRKAAEQGDVHGQYLLGAGYQAGDGVEKNEAEAVKWFRKAAEQEFADAQFELGMCYLNGTGVVKNETEAARWFRKAAEQGNKDAIKILREIEQITLDFR
jgi:TPR repeat protein